MHLSAGIIQPLFGDDAVKANAAATCIEGKKMTWAYPVTPQVLLQKVTGLSAGPLPHVPVQAAWPETSPCWGSPLGNWMGLLRYKLGVAAAWRKASLIISTLFWKEMGFLVFLLPALAKIYNIPAQQLWTAAGLIELGKWNLILEIAEDKHTCKNVMGFMTRCSLSQCGHVYFWVDSCQKTKRA